MFLARPFLVENQVTATPDLTNLIKLAEIFDCSLDCLILDIE